MKRLLPFILLLLCGAATAQVTKAPRPRPVATLPSTPCSPRDFVQAADTGNTSICKADGTGWTTIPAAGAGDISGSTGATDNAVLRADGTGGKTLQSSGVLIDDSNNLTASNVAPGLLSTATAAGTTTLTVASKGIQVFTGATTQTVVLPVVSTLPQIGFGYVIQNDSSGALTVNSSGGNLVQTVAAGARAWITCKLLTGTSAASWNVSYLPATFGITNSAGANVVPKSNGTNLVASQLTDDGTVVGLVSAVNHGTLSAGGTNTYRVFNGESSPTATLNLRGTYNFVMTENSVDVTGLSIGDSSISNIAPGAYPSSNLLTGTFTVNDTDGNGGVGVDMAAVNGNATVSSAVTAAVDGVDGLIAGGKFIASLTHSSTTGGQLSAYGVYAVATGALDPTVGNHGHYGVHAEVSGAGQENIGVRIITAPSATNNYGLHIDGILTSGANNYAIRSESAAQSAFGGTVRPITAGASSVGTADAPWGSLFVGNAANNSSQITGTFTGNRVATLPDATGTVLLSTAATVDKLLTSTNCADSAGAAACGSASAGTFVIDAAATTTVVSTTAVTANSQIFVFFDSSNSTRLGVTCNATVPTVYGVTARTAGTSFTLTATAPVTNPACFNYLIIN